MKKVNMLLAVLVVLTALGMGHAAARAAADPLSVFRAWEAAHNAGDVDAQMALFAPDAVLVDTFPAPGDSGVHAGSDALRALFASDVQTKEQSHSSNFVVAGDRLTVLDNRITLSDPGLPPGFPLPIESTLTFVVQDGKIRSVVIENKPEWIQKLLAVLGPVPAPEAGKDPLTVYRAFEAALNAHDVNAAVALFAPGAALVDTFPAAGDSGVQIGPDALRAAFTGDSRVDIHSVSSNIQVQAGERLTVYDNKITVDPAALPPGAPQPIESKLTFVVEDGKIQSYVIENTPEWANKLLVAIGQPPELPTSGSAAPSGALPALTLAVVLTMAGFMLRRRARRGRA